MGIIEFFELYGTDYKTKDITETYNSLSINDRLKVLKKLGSEKSDLLIDKIRGQAVKDFWTHEQQLLKNGMSTRDWTPDQIESIMNISEKTGIAVMEMQHMI